MESEVRFHSAQEKKLYSPQKGNALMDRFTTTKHVNQNYSHQIHSENINHTDYK